MKDFGDRRTLAGWVDTFSEIDRELARALLVCGVGLSAPGVVERIIHGDASVSGSDNSLAFVKLRQLLMMHFAVRKAAGERLGQPVASLIESSVVEQLKSEFPGLDVAWPPRSG